MSDREENLDMFGVENIQLSELDKYASELENDESERWPEAVRQMYDIFREELKKAGADESIAIRLISATCQNFGGMQFYLGRGDALKRHIRDLQIWHDFTGNNVDEIIKKYNVGYSQVYRIIARMRQREIKRNQPSLF
ncbi:transcriptional regulator [Vibrio fluvialis]|uniref:Mor transcription activator family protein n=1 Tax=Vibrio fluvialis TaxID=676 RepID=UPI001C9BE8EA|nr:Mor transcription activator family protein [Vibrio fluvialis]ELJ8641940.1 transcriptional regulator [Vibrio cholerae]ELE2164749.1 transcriptional regulator [Vibrio fluvialis]ELL9329708.1 transcriptional regulator [Vibrio fluvialis]MBY7931570.1 transcriptional regulator [Vibrio fluvialis]MBY8111715.1 transcriptional regulator [Vibrio fluvialis]